MQGTDTVLRMAVKDSLDASVGSIYVAGDARQQLWKRTSTDSPTFTVGHILECCHRRRGKVRVLEEKKALPVVAPSDIVKQE